MNKVIDLSTRFIVKFFNDKGEFHTETIDTIGGKNSAKAIATQNAMNKRIFFINGFTEYYVTCTKAK